MKKLVLILAMALVALGGGAMHLWRQIEAQQQQIADLQGRLKAMEVAQQTAAASFASQMTAALNHAAPPAATAPGAPGSSLSAQAAAFRDRMSVLSANLMESSKSPEARARRRALERAMLVSQYPDLGEALNLSPAAVDKLLDVVALQQEGISDQVTNNSVAPLSERANGLKSLQQNQAAELAALLGDKYPQWQEYKETLPARRQVTDLRAVLGAEGSSLSDDQAKPLLAALGAEQKRINQESRDARARGEITLTNSPGRSSPETQRRLIAAAAPHLQPQQLESYRKMLERQNSVNRAVDDMSGTAPPR